MSEHTPATASQTVGPFYKIGLGYRFADALCTDDAPGEHITVTGIVYDGNGAPVPDAQLELWQADDQGRYVGLDTGTDVTSPAFFGFARVPVDDGGRFTFRTIKPGTVIAADGIRHAPHILVLLFMRGVLKHLYTRIYFAAEPDNSTDPKLLAVPDERRSTLLAQPQADAPQIFHWNIYLRGDTETAFFEY